MRPDPDLYTRVRARLMVGLAALVVIVAIGLPAIVDPASIPAWIILALAFFPVLFVAVLVEPLTNFVCRLLRDTE